MKCPRCAAEIPSTASFCSTCGAALKAWSPPEEPSAGDTVVDERDAISQTRPISPVAAVRRARTVDEPERDLWSGSYSPKAMLGTWLLLAVFTLLAAGIGSLQIHDSRAWLVLAGVIVIAWLAAFAMLILRRLGIHYRLTSQRLFHEKGVLRRTIDRIELLRMDDITCEQGLIERMLGIGSIRIKSTDPSDPDFWLRGVENAREVSRLIDDARRAEQVRRGVFIATGSTQNLASS